MVSIVVVTFEKDRSADLTVRIVKKKFSNVHHEINDEDGASQPKAKQEVSDRIKGI